MIKILFFAKIRDQLGQASLEIEAPKAYSNIGELLSAIAEQLGADAAAVLSQPNVVVAINQEVAEPEQGIQAGDEVAFYPPVTGG